MSLFKKMMAKVGIGAAKVETELLTSDFVPGETMEALIKLSGGSTEQTIDPVRQKWCEPSLMCFYNSLRSYIGQTVDDE